MKKIERWAWGAALLAVAVWGGMRRAAPESFRSGGAAADPDPRTKSVVRGDIAPGKGGGRRPLRAGQSRAGMKARLARYLQATDPLDRMAHFVALLSSSDEGSIGEIEAAWLELKATGVHLPAEEVLLNHRLGQLKGRKVLEGHTGRAEDFASIGLLKSRYEGWLASDPFGAKAWLEELPAGKFRDQMAMSVIASSAGDNPLEALQQVGGLPVHLREAAGKTAGDRLRESRSVEEGSQLLAELGALGGEVDEGYLKGLFDSLAGAASEGGEPAISRLVEAHFDRSYVSPRALAVLSAEKAKADPLSALEWAAGMEGRKEGLSEGELLSATIRGMGLHDLDLAEAWARERPDSPGIAAMQASLEGRRRSLEDRGDDENEYDKDD